MAPSAKYPRLSRFGDWRAAELPSESHDRPVDRAVYSGPDVHERMALIRKSINQIRSSWQNYDVYMSELRELVSTADASSARRSLSNQLLDALFISSKRWWESSEEVDTSEVYSAIDLYTDEAGYQTMFSVINAALRSDQLTDVDAAARGAAFMVELLTIDLFNFRLAYPEADEYAGTVYRGMSMSSDQLNALDELASGPIEKRYVSVPLSMMSASRDQKVALAFAQRAARNRRDARQIIWNIQVTGLPAELLDLYRHRYPKSIVTSICAVPIDRRARVPAEQEVLLRGAFFQIVNMRTKPAGPGRQPLTIVDAIMLNSNRDHLTALASNEGADSEARNFFRTIVQLHRSRLCAELARDAHNSRDARLYDEAVAASESELQRQIGTMRPADRSGSSFK
jgi:hypothetical protein